jgi:hypothetical protein
VDEGSSSKAGAAGTAVAAVPDGSDGHGVNPDRNAAATPGQARPPARRRSAGGPERHPLPGAHGVRLAHAAQGLPALAYGLLVVPPSDPAPAVPHDPRSRPHARPRARRPRRQPDRLDPEQPVGEGVQCRRARLRCRQEDHRTQAPHRGGHRRAVADGPPHPGRSVRFRRRSAGSGRAAQTVALAQAFVRRWRLRPWPPAQQGRLPGLHRGRNPAFGGAKGLSGVAAPLGGAPPDNVARFRFEWSTVVERSQLIGQRRDTPALPWLNQHRPGGAIGAGGDAHGPVEGTSCRRCAGFVREHAPEPAMLGRGVRSGCSDLAQDHRSIPEGPDGRRDPAKRQEGG